MKFALFLLLFLNYVVAENFAENFSEIFAKPQNGKSVEILKFEPKDSGKILKIEFGRFENVDCNHHFFVDGNLSREILEGWGYEILKFDAKGEMAGTLMACKDNKKSKKFIKFRQNFTQIIKPNAPLAIYHPKDVKVEISIYKLESSEILGEKSSKKISSGKISNSKISSQKGKN